MGKSGFIAQKIAQTLVSTGTRAFFLNATDALHGDLGIISAGDLVVCVSKSGSTDELVRLVPYARVKPARVGPQAPGHLAVHHARPRQAKGARLASVASEAGCALDRLCDLRVHLPLERELCPFDLAPVTSTAIQMVFGDTVAIALMQARGTPCPLRAADREAVLMLLHMQAKHLTQDQYAMNHPAGRIGKRLILQVADVMIAAPEALPVVCCSSALLSHRAPAAAPTSAPAALQHKVAPGSRLRRCLQRCGCWTCWASSAPSAAAACWSATRWGGCRGPSRTATCAAPSRGWVQRCALLLAPGVRLLEPVWGAGGGRQSTHAPQVMETQVQHLMHSRPRTCVPTTKAVDAMQAGLPCLAAWPAAAAGPAGAEASLLSQAMEGPDRKVQFMPVEKDGHLVGLVTLHDLVSAGL